MTQLALFDPEPDAPDVTWVVPVDQYGRDLPPIVILDNDWKAATQWAYVASKRATALGPDATLQQLYDATVNGRHIFYALLGDRQRLDLELTKYGHPAVTDDDKDPDHE